MTLNLTQGMKSSEFVLALVANVLAILDYAHVWNVMPFHDAALMQTLITSAYALSRGWAKSGGINPADVPVFNPPVVSPPPAPSQPPQPPTA